MFRTFLNSITKMFVLEGRIRRGDSGALAPGSFPQTRCSDMSLRCCPLCGTTYFARNRTGPTLGGFMWGRWMGWSSLCSIHSPVPTA